MSRRAQSPGRTWGAPRKVDHRTGSTPAFAMAVASSLPGVEAAHGRRRQSFNVSGRTFLALEPDESVLVCSPDGAEHSLLLHRLGRDELRDRIEEAWAGVASPGQRRSRAAARRKRQALAPVTREDIRGVVLGLPGAVEGPIWGKEIGFLIGTEKRTRFARFGPPAGSGIGNLLPPDDEDALVIFHCPQKPSLLASCPERFFTTPHYGPAGEPGGVITRLAENRGETELQELAELLEDSWREVAPPSLVEQRDAEQRLRR